MSLFIAYMVLGFLVMSYVTWWSITESTSPEMVKVFFLLLDWIVLYGGIGLLIYLATGGTP